MNPFEGSCAGNWREPSAVRTDLADAIANLRAGLEPAQQLLRALVTRGDAELLRAALGRLDDLTEPWAPTGRPVAETRKLLREIDGMILVMVMWAAHLFTQSEDSQRDASAPALALLLDKLDDPNRALQAYEVVSTGRGESFEDDWSFWFYDDERGGVQSLDADPQLDRALILALTVIAATRGSLRFQPHSVLDYRGDGLQQALAAIESDSRWGFLVPASQSGEPGAPLVVSKDDPFSAALGLVRESLRNAAGERAQVVAEQIRQAGLDAEQVQRFRRATVRAARSGRVIRDLMSHVGATRSVGRPDPLPNGFRTWMSKRFFTGDASYVGQDTTARELARRAKSRELGALLEALPDEPIVVGSDVRDTVVAAIRAMRTDGLSPSLVLIPIGYELPQALGVNPFGCVALDGAAIPAAHSGAFNGLIDDVPVLDDPRIDSNRLFIVDLAGAVRLEEWPSDSNAGVEISVQAFDADDAAAFVEGHPAVVPADSTPADTTELLQERVLIEMNLCWRIAARDRSAVRVVEIPEALRREVD